MEIQNSVIYILADFFRPVLHVWIFSHPLPFPGPDLSVLSYTKPDHCQSH